MSGQVGKRVPYIDAVDKVTGQAKYAGDFSFPDMLHVCYLRSPHPHARIIRIDTTAAASLPGVAAIVTGNDLPNRFGILPVSADETAIAVDKVRYIGEIVAAVAADSESTARHATKLIKVKYEPIRSFLMPEESLQSCHKDEQIHSHTRDNTNIHKKAELCFGNPKERLDKSESVASGQFSFAGVTHAFTEPLATVAIWNSDKTLTVISATQVPHYLHRTIASVLGLPMHRVQVKKPSLGGGFGGKSDPFPHEIIAAFVAMKTGRTVKTVFSREEVFFNNHGRHPTELNMTLGCDKNGRLTALDADIIIDGGAYGSFGVVTTYYNGVMLQGPYRIDDFKFRTRRVYTNKPQSGAMRGHGAVNPRYAVETLLDMLARDAGIDPCDLRMKNFLPSDTLTVGQLRITSNGVKDCLDAVRGKSDWNNRYGKLPYGHGLGVACGFYISGSALPIIWNDYPQTIVHAKLDFDGRVVIFSGASDIGQGSDTILTQIASEVLGITMDRVRVESADTLLTPVDLGSYSSRVTFMVGNACKQACENLRAEIARSVGKAKSVPVEEITFCDNRLRTRDGNLDIDWVESATITLAGRGAFVVSGHYISPKMGGTFKGAGAGLSPAYSFGAFISEVKVDTDSGDVRVVKVWGAHDCGKAINPLSVEGQIEGCIHMGLGQAISEELRYDKGRMVNADLCNYQIPTAIDTPEMDITIIESDDREGPFGAKEAGEGPIHPVLPSIGNAVYDAVGVRMFDLPVRPERVLAAIRAKESGNE